MKEFYNIIDCKLIKNLYFMLKDNGIIEIYDKNLEYIEKISFDSLFSSITYNDDKNIFYLSKSINKHIYISNNLKIFTPIKIDIPDCYSNIKKIFYCKYYNSLLITTSNAVFMFDLANKKIKKIFEIKDNISKYNDCTSPLGCKTNSKITLIGAICCCEDIYIAYRTNNMSIIKKLDKTNPNEIVYMTPYLIRILFIANEEIWAVIEKNCHQELISTGIPCICDNCDTTDCKCLIIESIACIEKSLAKILNSESLKIKSAIDKSDNIKDLICINSSVKETIYYITVLEFILTEKLKLVSEKQDC